MGSAIAQKLFEKAILAVGTTIVGAFVGGVVDMISGRDDGKGVKIGASVGLLVGLRFSLGNLGNSGASALSGAVKSGTVTGLAVIANNVAVEAMQERIETTVQNNMASYASNPEGSGGGDDEWSPFYKSDLKTYAESKGKESTEKNLGDELENIFEEFINSKINWMNRSMKFRRAGKVWTEGTGRNSKSDFVSDDFYDERSECSFCPRKIKWVIEGSGYEVKQNNGKGIYLSSNTYQIKGHIDNLAMKHANDIATKVYNPSLNLITTYDVKWSPGISLYAGRQGVQFTHRRAMYRMINGIYQFKFVGFGTSSW